MLRSVSRVTRSIDRTIDWRPFAAIPSDIIPVDTPLWITSLRRAILRTVQPRLRIVIRREELFLSHRSFSAIAARAIATRRVNARISDIRRRREPTPEGSAFVCERGGFDQSDAWVGAPLH